MELIQIKEGLPSDVTMQLMSNEAVYYFSYISFQGGCGSNQTSTNHWIALSNNRVLYKTKVQENQTFIEKDGILPFDKISFIEVSEVQVSQGCSQKKSFQLRISTSGGTLVIPIPTKEKGYEIRGVFTELSQLKP
ncbi:MAG: hypothetical protein H0U87_00595 [Acidobacteria bacterium]|nr:hypothetical protein [Acidobacteriota bacterium]